MTLDNKYHTIEEFIEMYPESWIFMEDYKTDDNGVIMGGIAVAVCKEEDLSKTMDELLADGKFPIHYATYPAEPLLLF